MLLEALGVLAALSAGTRLVRCAFGDGKNPRSIRGFDMTFLGVFVVVSAVLFCFLSLFCCDKGVSWREARSEAKEGEYSGKNSIFDGTGDDEGESSVELT